jgi:2,4-diketo-3-deoxy-L-fuconate hydrolase
MKLLRFGPAGQERPGLLDPQGRIRDLSQEVRDFDGGQLSPAALDRLASIKMATLPVIDGDPRLGPPVTRVGKFIAIGLNFSDHAAESNLPIPAEPVMFMKATSCIVGPNDPVVIPRGSTKTDWEVELGVVMERGRATSIKLRRSRALQATWSFTTSPSANTRLSGAGRGTRERAAILLGRSGLGS